MVKNPADVQRFIRLILLAFLFAWNLAEAEAPVTVEKQISTPANAAHGMVPGGWVQSPPGSKDYTTFEPDPGYGDGKFAISLESEVVLGFDLYSPDFFVCRRIGWAPRKPLYGDRKYSKKYNRYQCGPHIKTTLVFFVEFKPEMVPIKIEELAWTKTKVSDPPFFVPGGCSGERFFFERTATPKILKGESLFHGACLFGAYPPIKKPTHWIDEPVADGRYEVIGHALYVGEIGGAPRFWLKSTQRLQYGGWHWAFLPNDSSILREAEFTHVYSIPDGFLIRVRIHDSPRGADGRNTLHLVKITNGGGWEIFSAPIDEDLWN